MSSRSRGPVVQARRRRGGLDRVRQRYGLAERIILPVGTIEPRKNLPKLIDAFAARRRAGLLTHQLVCVGTVRLAVARHRGTNHALEVGDAIRFTGYVPFDDLPAIYSLAEMFVFPRCTRVSACRSSKRWRAACR